MALALAMSGCGGASYDGVNGSGAPSRPDSQRHGFDYDKMIVGWGHVGEKLSRDFPDTPGISMYVAVNAELYMQYVQENYRDTYHPDGYDGQQLTLVSTGTSDPNLIEFVQVAGSDPVDGAYAFTLDFRSVQITYDGDRDLFRPNGPPRIYYLKGHGVIGYEEWKQLHSG
ncbi:MAG: hypothetical protein FWG15_02730 [Propionibacteriaceae bacterium]|nr:hypothetical protein [Propionibacteriaceae bacterium]